MFPRTLGVAAAMSGRKYIYYVDAVGGNDSNNGLGPSSAWKTLSKVNISDYGRILYLYDRWSDNPPYYDFSGMPNGDLGTGWLSGTFTISSGSAINNPTLGSELTTDGGLETWTTATNLTSWTETIAGTSTVNQESSVKDAGAYAARLDVDASNSGCSISQAIVNSAAVWLMTSWRAKCSATTTKIVYRENGTGQVYPALTTSYATYYNTHRALAANTTVLLGKDESASKSIYLDAISIKQITFAECLAFRTERAPSTDVRATAAVTIPISGVLGGVAVKWDSTSNPQSGLLAYICGAYPGWIYLDKCVAGTWTNLIKVEMTTAEATKYMAGEFVEVTVDGTDVTLRYRGGTIGAVQTVSDAEIASNTLCGLFSTDSSVLIHNFAIDYRTTMVTPEVLPSNIEFNHQHDRRMVGPTTVGDMGGFSVEVDGTLTSISRARRVIEPTRGGLYSSRFEVRNGDYAGSVNSGERAEVYQPHNPSGTDIVETSASGELFYGISIYLPDDWVSPTEMDPTSGTLWNEVLQLHPSIPAAVPTVCLHVLDTIKLSNYGGNLDGTRKEWTYHEFSNGAIIRGQWIDFILRLKHALDLTGEIQVWRRDVGDADFTSVLSLTDVPTLLTSDAAPDNNHYWRRGVYRAEQTSELTNVLYQGPFIRGTTYADVVAALG